MPRTDTTSQRAPTTGTRRQVDPLTEIEGKILDFMVQYLRANTYQPSIREIGERFGIKSTKTVSEHLQALADKGFLERDPSRSRGVKILGVDLGSETVSVPCFSHLPTGAEDSADGPPETHLSIDRRWAGAEGAFFVRAAAGDLAVLGVEEGDYLLVEPVALTDVDDGAVVVASDGGGRWYHRLARNGSGLALHSLRPGGDVTHIAQPSALNLIGRVTAFYRRMDERAGSLNLTQH